MACWCFCYASCMMSSPVAPLCLPTGVHVPAVPQSGLYPFPGCVSQRYQASEPLGGPGDGHPQTLWLWQVSAVSVHVLIGCYSAPSSFLIPPFQTVLLWVPSCLAHLSSPELLLFYPPPPLQCEAARSRRAKRVLYLLAVLPCPGAHLWRHRLHIQHRHLVSRLRAGRAAPGPAHFPRGQRRGPASGDHQGTVGGAANWWPTAKRWQAERWNEAWSKVSSEQWGSQFPEKVLNFSDHKKKKSHIEKKLHWKLHGSSTKPQISESLFVLKMLTSRFNRRQVTSFRRKIWLLLNINEACFVFFPLGSGNTNKGADPGNEPQLHRVQIPTDQSTSLDEGRFIRQQVVRLCRTIC